MIAESMTLETQVLQRLQPVKPDHLLPISVIIPVRNESHNLSRCLASIYEAGEVYVIDSQSSDDTVEIARSFGAKVVQFYYHGGWPKKRQWALDTLPLVYDWVLLLDADEALTPELASELRESIRDSHFDGYYISLQMHFLGQRLRHAGADFHKLSLFRRGKGHFECRLRDQNPSMGDMEVHEHVIVKGKTGRFRNPLRHYNVESLSRYIRKHDDYSNWEAKAWLQRKPGCDDLAPSLFGTQAQRRRWLKSKFFGLPGSPLLFFLYRYLFRLGLLDGVPGLIYCAFQGIQFFHIKAKIYELQSSGNSASDA
ncbi:MAG TPA: glycosyltransferase family 2 protein [Terriglobales bacterium]|nr:glycosyltransferase family 2 protein [Terriglobales bacterium]HXY15190.1 glycosyltransferase family 2 protein [Terriglobales bacterium]